MGIVNLNCRNFKCRFNHSGDCSQSNIALMPQGSIVDQVRCVEAGDRVPGDKPVEENKKGGNGLSLTAYEQNTIGPEA